MPLLPLCNGKENQLRQTFFLQMAPLFFSLSQLEAPRPAQGEAESPLGCGDFGNTLQFAQLVFPQSHRLQENPLLASALRSSNSLPVQQGAGPSQHRQKGCQAP